LDILTKIAVIVLVVMVLLSVGIFSTYLAAEESALTKYEAEQQRREALEQQLRNAMVAQQRAQTEAYAARQDARRSQAEMKTAVTRARNEARQAQMAYAGIRKSIEEANQRIASFDERVKTFNEKLAAKDERIDKLMTACDTLGEELTRVQKSWKEDQARLERRRYQVEGLQATNKALEAELKKMIEKWKSPAAGATARAGEATPADAAAGVALSGVITHWWPEQRLAQVSFGSAQGARKDMKLVISREGRYVGDLVLKQVNRERAAGPVDIPTELVPQPGDTVRTEAALQEVRGHPGGEL